MWPIVFVVKRMEEVKKTKNVVLKHNSVSAGNVENVCVFIVSLDYSLLCLFCELSSDETGSSRSRRRRRRGRRGGGGLMLRGGRSVGYVCLLIIGQIILMVGFSTRVQDE